MSAPAASTRERAGQPAQKSPGPPQEPGQEPRQDVGPSSAAPARGEAGWTGVPGDLTWRVLKLLNVFRLLVPLVLASMFILLSPRPVGQFFPATFVGVLTAYFLFALVSITSIQRRWPEARIQILLHVAVDIVALILLTHASGGLGSGLGMLLILPVGAASFVVSLRTALLFAAFATIGLLGQQGMAVLADRGAVGDFAPAGIIGAIAFMLAFGASPVARRLRESEALIRQRDVDLADLAQLNEFIVQHLRESILVVDAADRIRLINSSAEQLLKGSPVTAGTLLGEVSPKLLYLLDTWRRKSYDWQSATMSLVSADSSALIQPHFVSLEQENRGPTLIFLEDTTVISERVQQSKLAALGRLSASIAHEIRNPVGAMSHAAQLLRESEALNPQDLRLTDIIKNNSARVSSIIENVLQLSRRDTTRQERLDLRLWLKDFVAEFRQTFQLEVDELRVMNATEDPASENWATDTRTLQRNRSLDPAAGALKGSFEDDLEIRVDPSHLHQLLWNLCENATKYARSEGGHLAVDIILGRIPSSHRPYLEVADRGPGIDAKDIEQIFEPFFTSGAGGTGLGLFISRELAQCNRAVLAYEARQGGGSIFRVVFADPQRWEV